MRALTREQFLTEFRKWADHNGVEYSHEQLDVLLDKWWDPDDIIDDSELDYWDLYEQLSQGEGLL